MSDEEKWRGVFCCPAEEHPRLKVAEDLEDRRALVTLVRYVTPQVGIPPYNPNSDRRLGLETIQSMMIDTGYEFIKLATESHSVVPFPPCISN